MTHRFGLKNTTIQKINGVLAKYPQVKKTVIYGSRAKGNFKPGSDIDLVLYGEAELTQAILYRILQDIDDLSLPYTCDISLFHTLQDADLIDHIHRVGKELLA